MQHPGCPSAQQGRALHCALSIVLFTSNPDDKLMSVVPIPIQAHFIAKKDMAGSSQYHLAQETGVGSMKKYLRAWEGGKWASQSPCERLEEG